MALSSVTRYRITKTASATPVISTTAYTAGDQIGGIMTLSDVVRVDTNSNLAECELRSAVILDGDQQKSAIDIWFFNQSPTVTSTDNAPFAMTRANQQAQCIGAISIGTAYSDAAAVSTSTDGKNIILNLQSLVTATSPTNLYAIAIARGTPTYTTTSSLKFLFSVYVD